MSPHSQCITMLIKCLFSTFRLFLLSILLFNLFREDRGRKKNSFTSKLERRTEHSNSSSSMHSASCSCSSSLHCSFIFAVSKHCISSLIANYDNNYYSSNNKYKNNNTVCMVLGGAYMNTANKSTSSLRHCNGNNDNIVRSFLHDALGATFS